MTSDVFRAPNLKGKVAVVTGASRGIGRGIAIVLGEAGSTVYVTGRSLRSSRTENMPGSIDETAEAVTVRGGVGIAVRCDHTVDNDVEALFQRVREEQGRLDLLVNNVWGGYEQYEFERLHERRFGISRSGTGTACSRRACGRIWLPAAMLCRSCCRSIGG